MSSHSTKINKFLKLTVRILFHCLPIYSINQSFELIYVKNYKLIAFKRGTQMISIIKL